MKLGLILISTCVQGLMAWATSIRRCLERRHQEEAFCRRDSSRTLVTDPGPSSQPICPSLQQGSQSNVKTSLRQDIQTNKSQSEFLTNIWFIQNQIHYIREAPQKNKRENVGIFPKWGAPPPLPPVWEPHVCEKKLRFILHFRTLGTFLVFTKMFTYGWYYGL